MNRDGVCRKLIFAFLALLFALPALASPVNPNPVPVLYPITPSATGPGGPTYPLTVRGAGFVSGSTVNWNGLALTTIFVSSAQLSAAVPASNISVPTTATITVVSPAPGGGISNPEYFEVQDAVPQNYFSSQSITGNANLTSPIVGGDFNKDGKLDIAVASGANVYVLAGTGNGSFATAQGSNGPSNSVITSINITDVNKDGKQDLVVGGKRGTTGLVATMLGNGNGTFQTPIETDYAGVASSSNVVADFNGDGILDVALVSSSSVKILLGNGDGTFHAGTSSFFSTYLGKDGVAAADFNGDGILDLLITSYDPNSTNGFSFVGFLAGVGDGTFQDIVQVAGSGAEFVGSITAVVGDFNGDGKLDIATGIQTAGPTIQGLVYLSLGNGDGTFAVGTSVPNVGSVTTPLLVGDFNADGNLDLATGGYFYFGEGNGTFPTSNGSASAPTFVLAGDANNDGLLDVIDEVVTTTQSRSGSSTTEAAGIELQVAPLPDFKGVVAPLNSSLVPGGSVSFTVTLTPLYGFVGDVTMGATNLPNGITPSYSPVTIKGGNGSTTITLTASNSIALGNYGFDLSGNSGGLTHTTVVPVTVNSSVGDFGGSINPTIQNISQGSSAVFPIAIAATGGFTGNVVLSVTGLPSGATATFSQNPVNGGSGTSDLTITTSGSTPSPSLTTVTVTATSGTLTHMHSVYLGVAPTAETISGSITPSNSISASAGGAANYVLNLTTSNNTAQADMTLAVDGLPTGATAAFSPATINTGNGTATMQVVAPGGLLVQGSYPVLITMKEDGSIAQNTVVLNVGP